MTTISEMSPAMAKNLVDDIHLYLTVQDDEHTYLNTYQLVDDYLGEMFHQGDQGLFGLDIDGYTYTSEECLLIAEAYGSVFGEVHPVKDEWPLVHSASCTLRYAPESIAFEFEGYRVCDVADFMQQFTLLLCWDFQLGQDDTIPRGYWTVSTHCKTPGLIADMELVESRGECVPDSSVYDYLPLRAIF